MDKEIDSVRCCPWDHCYQNMIQFYLRMRLTSYSISELTRRGQFCSGISVRPRWWGVSTNSSVSASRESFRTSSGTLTSKSILFLHPQFQLRFNLLVIDNCQIWDSQCGCEIDYPQYFPALSVCYHTTWILISRSFPIKTLYMIDGSKSFSVELI